MKKLREVTQITGVSRRALQEYNKMGLVSPTDTTEAGYWLYDDNAINRILFIQTFVEVGYDRKRIKGILNDPEFDIKEEIVKVIELLEEKKRHIDGLINFAKNMKTMAGLPTSTLTAMQHFNFIGKIQGSYAEELEKSVDALAALSEEDMKAADQFSPIFYHLMAIGSLKEYKTNSKLVQNCVNEFYRYFVNMIDEDSDEKTTEEEMYSKEYVSEFIELIQNEIISDDDINKILIQQCGTEGVEYIKKAFDTFMTIAIKGYWIKK